MPVLHTENGPFHYELAGPSSAPVLLFSNSLGTDLSMWHPQAQTLAQDFRVLRYDGRGQGQSVIAPGPYTIDTLAGAIPCSPNGRFMSRGSKLRPDVVENRSSTFRWPRRRNAGTSSVNR